MTPRPRATARIYKGRDTGRWTVELYWRGVVIDRRLRRTWDDARVAAVWWANA